MQIWNYHPVTGELLGPGVADPNPVEIGEWILPAHATTVAPGEPQPGRAYRFTGSGWQSLADHRGETWWAADAKDNTDSVLVGFIGDPTEHGLTNVEPPAPPIVVPPVIVSALQIRLALNALKLRAAIEQYVVAADQDLRDIWQFGTEFKRDNALILAASDAIGAPEEVDALFALAKSL